MSTKEIKRLPLSAVFESPDNPRKSYDQSKLQELADSIAAHGVQQPIKVRMLPMLEGAAHFTYEIIFGHRRYRACKLAGLDDIPCMIEQEMSDEEAHQLRLIENIQREDVSPVEEAEALVRLIKEFNLDKDVLAMKLGISRTTLYNKMKLASAHSKVLEQCREGNLGGELATKLARLPLSVQPIALKKIMTQRPDPEKGPQGTKMVFMAVREADQVLKGQFTAKLAGAPFDATLADLTDRPACASCNRCSDAVEALLADLGAGVCTDLDCFGEKKEAYVHWRINDAKARGVKVIEGAEALAVQPSKYAPMRGYSSVKYIGERGIYPGEEQKRYIGYSDLVELAGDSAPTPAILVSPFNDAHEDKLMEVITEGEEYALLALIHQDEPEPEMPRTWPAPVPPEVEAVRSSWRQILVAITQGIRSQKTRTTDEMRYMVMAFIGQQGEIPEFITEAWGWDAELDEADDEYAFMTHKLEAMSADEVGQLLVALAVDLANPHDPDERLALAATYGVDVIALSKAAQAQADAMADAEEGDDLTEKSAPLENLQLQLEDAGAEA